MAGQAPKPEKFSFKQQADMVNWLIQFPALSVMVFCRWDLGYRAVSPLRLIGTTLAMVVLASFKPNPDNRPQDLMLFAVLMLIAGLIQRFVRWQQVGQGVLQHSYYIGTSLFRFRWLPGFMKRNRKIERFFDPLCCFAASLMVISFSPALGLWLLFSSLCLRFFEYAVFRERLHRNLDMVDGVIHSETQSDAVEHFTKPPGGSPPSQVANGGIPTGMGNDIRAKIKGRKADSPIVTQTVHNPALAKPKLTLNQIIRAFVIALLADSLQLPFHGTTVIDWFYKMGEWGNVLIASVMMITTIKLVGFHRVLLPTLLIELIPELNMLPAWTACVAYIAWQQRRNSSSLSSVQPAQNS